MAITARFDADFSSFNTAVKDAEVSLKGLDGGAKNVEKSIGGLDRSFSDLNIKDKLSDPVSAATDALIGIADELGVVGIALGAAATAGALWAKTLIDFTKEAAEVGGTLNDMSDKTGIAVPALSNLSAAAQIAGSSIEQVSSAINIMQQRMVEGGPQVEKGFQRIGLSISQIRSLSPDQQFIQIATALKSIGDPAERAATAIEIFGRQGRELLPLLSKDLEGLIAESQRLGLTWTEDNAKAAEKFQMESKALDLVLRNLKTTIGVELIPLLTIPLTFAKNSLGWLIASSPVGQLVQDMQFLNTVLDRSVDKLQSVKPAPGFAVINDSVDMLARGLMLEAAAAQTAELANEAFAKSATKAAVEVIKAESERSKIRAEGDKIRLDQLDRVNKAVLDSFEKIQRAEQDLYNFEAQQVLSATDFKILKIWEEANEQIKAFKGTEEQRKQFNTAILTLASAQADALYATEAELAEKTAAKFEQVTEQVKQSTVAAREFVGVLSGEVASALGGFAASLDKLALTPGSSLGFGHGQLVQSTLTLPARAGGGPVSAGQPYMVGEQGPEMFTPSSGGWISPNGGGPAVIQLVLDGRVISEVVAKDLMRRSSTKMGAA